MSILTINHLHQNYIMSDKYKLWKRGGYANIFKYNNNLIKVLPKFELYEEDYDLDCNNDNCIITNNSHTINNSSIIEAFISRYLPKNSHFIYFKTIYSSDSNIYISQSYKGLNLNEWKKCYSREHIIKTLPDIISQLLSICIFLELHGIFYTDLKLCNLLWDGNKLYLIDYNCISFQILYKNNLSRTDAVGTWMYAAPELILTSKISKYSSVWSIGMIICELLDDYPINTIYYPKYNTIINDKSNWNNIYNNIYASESKNNTAFINSYKNIPYPWNRWVRKMICWVPKNRISKVELLHEINNLFNLIPIQITYTPKTYAYPYHNKYNNQLREKFIKMIYDYSKPIEQEYKVCNAIYIWDSYSSQIHSNNETLALVAAWNIVSIILNEYTYDDVENEYLCELFSIDNYEDVYKYIWKICEFCDWNLYQKSTDIFIYEYNGNINWDNFLKFYSSYTKPYCSYSLFFDFVNITPSYLKK